MSGVALTAASAGLTPTVKAKDPLGDFLPGPPIATREFEAGDTLMFFAEFYENGANNPHMVDLKAELRAEGGRVVREATEQRSSSRGARRWRLRLRRAAAAYRSRARPLRAARRGPLARRTRRRWRAAISRCGSNRPLASSLGSKPPPEA